MNAVTATMGQLVAEAARAYQQECTGHAPRAVTAVLSEDTLVITLQDALTPAEIVLARTPEGATQVQEYHRQLFESSAKALRLEIGRITGVGVGESAVEIEESPGSVAHAFASGTVVQIFRLASSIQPDAWRGKSAVQGGSS